MTVQLQPGRPKDEARTVVRHRETWTADHEAGVDELIALVPFEPMPETPVRHGRLPRRFGLAEAIGVVVIGSGAIAAGMSIEFGLVLMGVW